ncbi:hypothetical protein V8F20_006433 [Naviculisporaceae sp. PSN 640]
MFSLPALLVSALATLATATPVPEPQRIVIPPAQNAWQARHGLTNAQYQTTFNNLVNQGYRLTWVDGYAINNDPRFAAIWEQTNENTEWVARHGLDAAGYQAAFNQYANQGFRLKLVNGYTVNNTVRYAAIWDKSYFDGAWVARHGLTNAQYQSAFDQYVGQGYKLVHVSGYTENNQPRFAAIWHRLNRPGSESWVARHGLTKDAYWREFNNLLNQGYRLINISPYVVNNVEYFAAIWDTSKIPYWGSHHDLTSSQYQTAFDQYNAIGAKLLSVSPYTLRNNQDRYAPIFTRNY